MTNTPPKNVVSITDYQKLARPLTQNEASKALDDCRSLALTSLNRTLGAMLDKMDDDLMELADKAANTDEQRAFLDARREARIKRTTIEAVFKKQFLALFGEKAGRKTDQKPPADPFSSLSLELSLVDEREVEENIAISNMASELQNNCEGELQALVARISYLLNSPDLDLKANPVSPEVIHNTFKAACQQIEAGFTVKLAIMHLFDRQLANDLPAIYKEINNNFIAHQILPDIRPGYRGKPKSGNPARPATGQGDATTQSSEGPQEVFALLQQLLTSGNPSSGHNGAAQASVPTSITAGFLDSLNRIQHGENGLLPNFPSGMNAEAFTQGAANVLHEIKSSSLAAGVGQLDAITIDIVAMLFDYIFEDPKIPEAMKNLIGRLQIPVLKVAMLDKTFFSSKAHPARRLLDTLGAAVIGRGDKLSESDPLHKEAQRIVQRVLAEFESDIAVFSELLTELENFLANEEKEAEETIERSAKIIHDRERLEIGRVVAEEEVRQRVEGTSTITLIRAFLQTSWVHVLTIVHAKSGEDSSEWRDALKAMDMLLWSVKSKKTADDRKLLVTRLPALLKRLNAGVAAISMDLEEQKEFFANLVTIHTRVIKSSLGGETSQPESDSDFAWTVADHPNPVDGPAGTILDSVNEANAESALVRKSLGEGDVQIEEVTLANETKAPRDADQDHRWAALTASLKRGSWVDFKQEDGRLLRYKLSWMSPLKNVYLFTNMSNQKALSISPQAMEKQLREGTARILEDTPLMDRAVENMLENLQQKN